MKPSVRIAFLVIIAAMIDGLIALKVRNSERESRAQPTTTETTP